MPTICSGTAIVRRLARYARLIDDIRNDSARLPQFFETAARVLDIDQKRRKSLNYVSGLSASERNKALRRIYENQQLVLLVRAKLIDRVSSYHFALERLVIMTPSAQAADVEHLLNNLRAEIARYERMAPRLGCVSRASPPPADHLEALG